MKSMKLAIIISSLAFTSSTLFLCIGFSIDGIEIKTTQLFTLFLGALAIGILTALRVSIDNKKWMLKLSHIVKRLVFLPFYLGISLITSLSLGYPVENSKGSIFLYIIIFLVSFTIISILKNTAEKKKTITYMNQINEYKKKLEE